MSKQHIRDVLKIAERHQIPIIADEVYEFFVFPNCKFYSFSSLSTHVPILSCSGLTKRFIMPGYENMLQIVCVNIFTTFLLVILSIRMGWIVIHDRNNHFQEIKRGLLNIAGRNFWPSSTVQLALPDIIRNTPKQFFEDNSTRVYVS